MTMASASSSVAWNLGMRSSSSGRFVLVLVEDARLHQLAVHPGRAGCAGSAFLEAEVEPLDELRSLLGQLHADGRGLLEARDGVAAEAAVAADRLLAEEERALVVVHGRRAAASASATGYVRRQEVLEDDARRGLPVSRRGRGGAMKLVVLEAHQVGGDVGRLLVREPQVRHPRLVPVALGVAHPGVEPARVRPCCRCRRGAGRGRGRRRASRECRRPPRRACRRPRGGRPGSPPSRTSLRPATRSPAGGAG